MWARHFTRLLGRQVLFPLYRTGNQSTDWLRAFCRDTYGVQARVWTRVPSPWFHMGHCTKEQLRRQRPWPNPVQRKVKRWRLTELFTLSSSLPNIHPLDKGLPSLSLHALLAQLDINALMAASSQSILSSKKKMSSEQGLILSHASLTKPTALTLDQMDVFPISEKCLCGPGYQRCGMVSTSTVGIFP